MTEHAGDTGSQKTDGPCHAERRRALKLLVAGAAGAATAALVPGSWTRPLATVGVLPAHAQTSEVSGNVAIDMAWYNPNTDPDYELHVVDPGDGADVFSGNTPSATLQHDGDAPVGYSGSESVVNRTPNVVAAGTYQVYLSAVDVDCGESGETLTVTLTVNGTPTVIDMAPHFAGDVTPPLNLRVADVTFPGGIVTNRAGQAYP